MPSGTVSIPHRQSKNVGLVHGKATLIFVSIPHRQSKNGKPFLCEKPGACEFQFLIGSLKTEYLSGDEYTFDLFQFLIGSLKTKGQESKEGQKQGFNSS